MVNRTCLRQIKMSAAEFLESGLPFSLSQPKEGLGWTSSPLGLNSLLYSDIQHPLRVLEKGSRIRGASSAILFPC